MAMFCDFPCIFVSFCVIFIHFSYFSFFHDIYVFLTRDDRSIPERFVGLRCFTHFYAQSEPHVRRISQN